MEKRASYESSSTKAFSETNQAELDRIVKVLEDNAPDSYEYHLVKYINGNYDPSLKDHLFAAYKLKPDEREVNREMFGYYALIGDQAKQKEFALKIKNHYSKNVRNYFKNMVADAQIETIFLSGEEDAYPTLMLQSLGEIRSDITIVNMDFLQNDDYRMKIQRKLGMSNVRFLGMESTFIATALSALGDKAFISTTVSQRYIREPANFCFLTGLHYQYHCPDQKTALTNFWKKAQEDLKEIDLDSRYEKSLYGNYLPPLLTLYKLKILNEENDPVLKKGITLLAKQTGKEEAVNEILKAYEQIE